MKVHDVTQGTSEWHALRANHFTASEAPAMLGVSKYTTRNDLLQQKATGITPEVDAAKQALFNRGHEAEANARPIAETIIGADLFPATGTLEIEGLPLLASFDGITMLEDNAWENKLHNNGLVAQIMTGELEPHYWAQLEQQLLVSGANRILFTTSDGTEERTAHLWYESVPERRQQIIAGWKQFKIDLEAYEHTEAPAPVAAEPVKDLPAVSVQVSGSIDVIDNFKVFEEALRDFIDNRLIREPQTDQEFADLDAQIKSLKKAEAALDSAEASMLAQVATVDTLKRTKDMLHSLARDNRLMAEKLLKAEKEKRRNEIMQKAQTAFNEHIAQINATIGKDRMPNIHADFAGVMKGKKTITSLQGAVDDELARAKIEANRIADKIRLNLETLRAEAADFETLFADVQILVQKENDDLRNLINSRITQHKQAEEQRLEVERERIRQEEEARAEAAHKAAQAEAVRLVRQEEAARVEAEQKAQKEAAEEHERLQHQKPQTAGTQANEPATLKLGDIRDRLGFALRADFITETLGIEASDKQGRGMLYTEGDWDRICSALINHIKYAHKAKEAA